MLFSIGAQTLLGLWAEPGRQEGPGEGALLTRTPFSPFAPGKPGKPWEPCGGKEIITERGERRVSRRGGRAGLAPCPRLRPWVENCGCLRAPEKQRRLCVGRVMEGQPASSPQPDPLGNPPQTLQGVRPVLQATSSSLGCFVLEGYNSGGPDLQAGAPGFPPTPQTQAGKGQLLLTLRPCRPGYPGRPGTPSLPCQKGKEGQKKGGVGEGDVWWRSPPSHCLPSHPPVREGQDLREGRSAPWSLRVHLPRGTLGHPPRPAQRRQSVVRGAGARPGSPGPPKGALTRSPFNPRSPLTPGNPSSPYKSKQGWC